MNTATKPITPERERELVDRLVDFLNSRYSGGDLYDILRHILNMDHNRTHYFATRDGVVIPEKDADTPPTEKQKAYIQRLTKNLPLCRGLLEYEDYKEHPTRKTAAEFIAQA